MTQSSATYHLTKLRKKYLLLRSGEILLWSLAATLITLGVSQFLPGALPLKLTLSLLVGVVTFVARFLKLELHRVDEQRVVRFINQHYPALEESTDLLLKEEQALTSLQRIQRERTIRNFDTVYPAIRLPHHLLQAATVFIGSVVLYIALSSFVAHKPSVSQGITTKEQTNEDTAVKLPASVQSVEIRITPPAYTGSKPFSVTDPQLAFPEGSTVRWSWKFTDEIKQARLIFSGRDSTELKKEGGSYTAQQKFTESGFYQLRWISVAGEVKISDYFKLEVIADRAPDIAITNLSQFTALSLTDKLIIDLKSTIADDYGLKNAHIIATVSKGSGESVKFREETLSFTTPRSIEGKHVQASCVLNLLKLGMEPGDELYFYAEAFDIKTPIQNRSRTETYFIALQDTTSEETSVDAGLGVDLMPEYFRSQRQIIIDTEKLLKEKKQITKHAFNFRSNELGYDQKVLRLKYGEFLGEEFESGIALENMENAHGDEHEEEDVTKKFGHVHDKENEHNLVEEKKKEEGHHHEHEGETDPDKKEDPLEAFKHMHDDPEEATFFVQSIRSKLKAALAIMWDAELQLRLYEPEKSLPYQYKALKLLKEISNDSRIYVHKTGFDPPPLKEDKRLTGDLAEIKSNTSQYQTGISQSFSSIRKALEVTEELLQQPSPSLTASSRTVFLQAGNELSALALENPGDFLKSLSLLKSLSENEIPENEIRAALIKIQNSFWKALPDRSTTPSATQRPAHTLTEQFIQNLEALKHE
jgi:hypothetical protein